MIPIVGRLPLALARLFGVPGQGPQIVDGTIFPIIETDSAKPERAFSQGERLYGSGWNITGAAGGRAAVWASFQPGNNVMAIIEAIEIEVLATASTIEIYMGAIAAAGSAEVVGIRDTRLPAIGPTGSQMQVLSSTGAAPPPVNAVCRRVMGVGEIWVPPAPFVLVPAPVGGGTNQLMIIAASNAVQIAGNIFWRERPLASGELVV